MITATQPVESFIGQSLIDSEARYRRLFETAQDGILILDAETGMIEDVNPFLIEMLGYNRKEFIKKKLWEVGAFKDIEASKMAFNSLQVNEYIRYDDLPLRAKDGHLIQVEFVSNVYHVGGNKVIQCNIRDITARISKEVSLDNARKELEERKISEDAAREFSESIINTIREPLISLDQDLRVVSASRSFYDFFKVNPEETIGQLIYDLGNKQWDIPKLRELLENILPQKASFDNYEVEHEFATIGRRNMLLNARQILRGKEGKERIILLAIEDITQRREIEVGLEKTHAELNELATELHRASRAKSEFLANMSHELRTPLNSIIGFSEVLSDETFGAINEKQRKYINNVLTSGKHLLMLINQILDTAKIESGTMKLSISTLSMNNLLHEISMLVTDLVIKKELLFKLEIDEDLSSIEGDELKVKEIIYNLLSNAVKFTPAGGSIGLQAKNTESAVEIVVWDTGIGIATENMEKVFEGFFRVDTPYSRLTEGTGLGLPLSRRLAELHGGKLSVESAGLNKGTLIRLLLPLIARKE